METYSRKVPDGKQFDMYFPKPKLSDSRIQKNADLSVTLQFIDQVVRQFNWQTRRIAEVLQRGNIRETCKEVFDFTYDHIPYKKDDNGEEIRSPARAWHDRTRGIDCDCYSVFIASILCNLGIPVTFRVAKYKEENGFQHIYPIVPLPNGKYITMDPVVHYFDHEQKPILEKIDKKMDLNFLEGVDDEDHYFENEDYPRDYDDFSLYGMGDLGKGISLKNIASGVKKVVKQVSIKNVLNVVNKVNPVTVLLRNGLLAGMKINLFKVAGNMRWSYLSDAQAQQKGIVLDKLNKVRAIRKKLEDIFFGAGGKIENLKKAILSGKGNSDRNVPLSGLGGFLGLEGISLQGISASTPLPALLGDVYYSENEDSPLGEVATAASIAAASASIATIAGLLKSVGSLFAPGKAPANEAGEEGNPNQSVDLDADFTTAPFAATKTPSINLPSINSLSQKILAAKNKITPVVNKITPVVKRLFPKVNVAAKPTLPTSVSPVQKTLPMVLPGISDSSEDVSPIPQQALSPASSNPVSPVATPTQVDPSASASTDESFWDKNKKWIKPAAIGVGIVGALLIGYKMVKGNSQPSKLSGLEGVKRAKRKRAKPKAKPRGKTAAKRRRIPPVAMM